MDQRTCPRCLAALTPAHNQHLQVDLCRQCGGVFLDQGELARIVRKSPDDLEHLEHLAAPAATLVTDAGRGLMRCPACGTQMESYQYAACSGITLDCCPACSGIWADDGELGAISDHLARGHEVLAAYAGRYASVLTEMQVEADVTTERWHALAGVCGMLDWRPIAEVPPEPPGQL